MDKKLIKLIDKFESAVRADKYKGGGDPRDIPIIEKEYMQAKVSLIRAINELTPGPQSTIDKSKITKILTMISANAERDVSEFEGQSFTGKQNAMIKALADILKEVVNNATS